VKFDIGILATQPVPDIVRQVRLAESLGYAAAWIADTHLVCRELWVTLGACAAATSRIMLGPGVTVPHTRHVSVTASAILTLEELAPGRVMIGVGTGGSSAQTMGLRLEDVGRPRIAEGMAGGIRRLTRRESIRFESGSEGRVAWLKAPSAVPIYVAGSGPRMLEAAGRAGDGAIVYASTSPPILRAALECVARGAAESGRALGDLDIALWAPMSIGRDRDVARDHVRGRVASALRHPLPVELPEADRAAIARLRAGYDAFEHATAASRHRELVQDRFVDLMALAGTPTEIVAQVRAIAREVPEIRRIILLPQVPGDDYLGRDQIIQMFADEVLPHVQ
jgi:5,10-methylenetetrahydromethanopterin reductase